MQASPAPAWRGFGERGDLDLDFSHADRPRLVTEVLCACSVQASDPDAIWSLTLAERIGGLLGILALSEGGESLALHLRCAVCREALELAVPYAALLHEARRGRREPVLDAQLDAARSVRLRRPTGDDQRAWRARSYGSEREAIAAIAGSLMDPPGTDAADLERLSDAMASFDPLVCFQVSAVCPGCGGEATLPVDLEETLLAQLYLRQRGLLEQVHRLAAFYGWSEEEALAVPARRREQYLKLIEREGRAR